MRLVTILFIMLSLFSCKNQSFEMGQSISSNIYGGTIATNEQWRSVVALVRNSTQFCSGVLVASNIVLTAAHCVDSMPATEIFIHIGNGGSPSIHGQYQVKESIIYPRYGWHGMERLDFAYLVLDENIYDVEIIPSIRSDEELRHAVADAQNRVTLVGFGKRENGDHGIKYFVNTLITGVIKTDLLLSEEGKTCCNGDSGGPAFVQLSDGQWRLVGITSRGRQKDDGTCLGGNALYGQAHYAMNWVDSRMLFAKGQEYLVDNELKFALKEFSQAIALYSNSSEYFYKRAEIYALLGETELARRDKIEGVELEKIEVSYEYFWWAQYAYNTKDYKQALEILNKVIDLYDKNERYYAWRGMVYLAIGEYELALTDQNRACELAPEYHRLYLVRAKMYRMLGELEKAEADAKKAVELAKKYPLS